MAFRHWSVGLFGAALLFALGCQDEATSPSDPTRTLAEALTPEEEALADEIRDDIACLFDGGDENAMLKRFRNVVQSKEGEKANPLMNQAGEQIADIFEAFEDGDLNDPPTSPCSGEDADEVTERLIINLALFADLGELSPGFLTTEGENRKLVVFQLEEGATATTDDGCTGVNWPDQTTNTGTNVCTIYEPTNDPGFDTEGEDTAPFWLQIDCTFSGPYDPKILAGFYVIEGDEDFLENGTLFGFPAPPEGADLTACTIRDGIVLCAGDPDDGQGTLEQEENIPFLDENQCRMRTAQAEGFHGFVNRIFEPVSEIFGVRALNANPGNLGLRSSFSSPFGVQFAEEGEIDFTVDGDTVPVALFPGDSAFMVATVTPTPSPEDDAEIIFSAIAAETTDLSSDSIPVVEGLAQGTIICDPSGEGGFEAELVLGNDDYQTGAELVGTEQVSNIVNVSCSFPVIGMIE